MLRRILLLLVFTGFLWGQPELWIDRMTHSFGSVSPNGIVQTRFQIANHGTDILQLIRVETSCHCTSAVMGKTTLQPQEMTELLVSYDPKGQSGSVTKILTLVSNDAQQPVLQLSLSAEIVPAIQLSQDDLYFSGLLRSDRWTQTVRGQSTSGKPVRIVGMPEHLPPFLRVQTAVENDDLLVHVTIQGDRLPQEQTMGREPVTLRTNDPEMPELNLTVFWATGPAIQVTPRKIAFEPGMTDPQKLELQHARGRAFRILGASIEPNIVRLDGISPEEAPRHTLTVSLRPGLTSGLHSAQIHFLTNDPDEPEAILEVSVFVP